MIWNLSTDTIEPGPLVPTTPSSLVSVYSVEDSWLGLTMPTGSHGEAAEVLRSADPNAQLATLGRGAFVAWQEGGAFVSFARTQHVQGCDERLIVSTMSVADRIGRHTRPFLLCQKVVGLLRDSLSPYAVTVLPDHDRQVSRVFSDAMAPILTGYEPLGVSQNGDFLVRSSRGQAGMYYPSANPERNTPSMIVLHGNPLLVSRLLAWSTDGNIAYVLGSIGGVEGVFAITVGPRQEPGAPVLVVRTSDAEVVAASTVTNDLYVVAEGTVRFVHDGEVTAVLSPPPGAPGGLGTVALGALVAILALGDAMRIAIVGAGTAGTAVAVRWRRAGHTITAVAGRDATRARAVRWLPDVPFVPLADALPSADLVVLGVPDDALSDVVASLCGRLDEASAVLHLSGARGLDVLEPLERAGARGSRCTRCRPSPTSRARSMPCPARRSRSRRATTKVRPSATVSLATSAAARSRSPTRTGPCTTRPPSSRRTTSSRCRGRRWSCSPRPAFPMPPPRCTRCRPRRSTTSNGSARSRRSPVLLSAATPARSTGTSARCTRPRRRSFRRT